MKQQKVEYILWGILKLNNFWPAAFIISFVLKRSIVIVIFIEKQLTYVKYKKTKQNWPLGEKKIYF